MSYNPDTNINNGLGERQDIVASGVTADAETEYSGAFDFPTDIYPYSMSNSVSNQSSSSSGSQRSSNYTGLPLNYRDALLSSVMPTLQSSVQNYNQNVDDYLQSGMNSYNMQLKNALNEILPGIITNYGRRGILNSTVASDALGTASRGAVTDATTKGYDTAMLSAQLKASLPEILAQIASLGNYTQGSSSGSSSSSSTGSSVSSSYQEDQTKMYDIVADILATA